MRQAVQIIGIVGISFGFAYGVQHYLKHSKVEKPVERVAASQPPAGPSQPPPTSTALPAPSPEVMQLDVKRFKNFGMNALAANCAETTCSLDFEMKVVPFESLAGDWDAVLADMTASGDHQLLLTLEPLLKEADATQTLRIPLTTEELVKGKRVRLSWKKNDYPLTYGIFLCSDRKKEGRCNLKPYEEIIGLMKRNDRLMGKPVAAPEWPDHTYFFQGLLMESDGSVGYFPAPFSEKNAGAYSQFDHYLRLRSPLNRRDSANEQTVFLSQHSGTINSVPLKLSSNKKSLEATLPSNAVTIALFPSIMAKLPATFKAMIPKKPE